MTPLERADAIRRAAAAVRRVAPSVADAMERGAWKGEVRAALPWLRALGVLGVAIATWSAEETPARVTEPTW